MTWFHFIMSLDQMLEEVECVKCQARRIVENLR